MGREASGGSAVGALTAVEDLGQVAVVVSALPQGARAEGGLTVAQGAGTGAGAPSGSIPTPDEGLAPLQHCSIGCCLGHVTDALAVLPASPWMIKLEGRGCAEGRVGAPLVVTWPCHRQLQPSKREREVKTVASSALVNVMARWSGHILSVSSQTSRSRQAIGLSSGQWVGRSCHAALTRCRDAMCPRLGATSDVMAVHFNIRRIPRRCALSTISAVTSIARSVCISNTASGTH